MLVFAAAKVTNPPFDVIRGGGVSTGRAMWRSAKVSTKLQFALPRLRLL